MKRRIVAIINPASGRGGKAALIRRVAGALKQEGVDFEPHLTTHPGHATQLATACPDDVEAVLAVGGDGTVSEVVNGLLGRPLPVVILATGTENLLAREFGMQTHPGAVVRTLLHGEPFRTDVGVIAAGPRRTERRFLAITGFGFDAECVARLQRVRRGNITHGDYFWPIWRTFWLHRFPTLRVEVDGESVFDDRGFVLVGIIGRYSLGLRPLARARYDDGLLDVCVFPCSTRRALVRHAGRILMKRHLEAPGVLYRQGRRVTIVSPEVVPIEVDGDSGGFLPAELTIEPGAACFKRLR